MELEMSFTWPRVGMSILFVSVSILAYNFWTYFVTLWLKPLRAKRFFEAQGLNGMPYRFVVGNSTEIAAMSDRARSSPMPQVSHDIARRMLPHYFSWTEKLGTPFFCWFGPRPAIFVTEPELAREILVNKFGYYRKPEAHPIATDLLGGGLLFLEGEKWAQHRRIVSPAFFMDKLKAMTPTMVACVVSLLDDWAAQIGKEVSGRKEMDVHVEFRNLTSDIIARTAFGSSYADGKRVFEIQNEQSILLGKLIRGANIPGSRYVPTRTNRYRWKLQNQSRRLLRQMIYKRMEAIERGEKGDDLLGLMMAANRKELEGNKKNLSMSVGEIVDECKTFFLAGHETTSSLLTWTLLLLGTNTEWQERGRDEVLRVCGKEAPTVESLSSMKTVGMILNEALRLYPATSTLMREVSTQMKLGKDLALLQGTVVVIPVIAFHHDPKYWGHDADLFNPERFAEGFIKASDNPASFLPFSSGPRNCIGQSFALMEAKVAIALILQRFAFHLSPGYSHAPSPIITVQPKFGMQIVFEMISPKC